MDSKGTNDFKIRYNNAKEKLSQDNNIIKENRKLFLEFFELHENKLKRINGLRTLDNSTYKTLYTYIVRFRNIDKWFGKPLKDITKDDIKRVYDALEDGKIKSQRGTPIQSTRDYYNKIFKSKLFHMINKDDLAREVIEYQKIPDNEVKFITEDDFKKLLDYANTTQKKILMWLAWDIGENISSLLQLKKSDFYKEINPSTKEPEYKVNLKKEILKRSRKARTEITNYPETTRLLDKYLEGLKEEDTLFNFDYAYAKKLFNKAINKSGIKTKPKNQKPTWKDLRSGMACHLLKTGWSTDEVNARLGHKPSSQEIDKYVNFLAIDRHRPKKKVQEFELQKLKTELDDVKSREKAKDREVQRLKEDFEEQMKTQREEMLKLILKSNPELMNDSKLKQLVKNKKK